MIALHGHGDSLDSYRDIKAEMNLPHFNYLLLNAPKKIDGGFAWGPLDPRGRKAMQALRKRLFALVEELKEAGWKTEEIYWLGHSQGALVATDLVLHHRQAFGGVTCVSGYVKFFRGWKERLPRTGARRTPWLVTHGSRDRIIPLKEIRSDVRTLRAGDVPVSYREFGRKGHDFDYESEVPLIRKWLAEGPASLEIQ